MTQLNVIADPVICHCFKVRQSTIEDCVTLYGAVSALDVKKSCRAGGGCMACRRRIQNLIDQIRQPEPESDSAALLQ